MAEFAEDLNLRSLKISDQTASQQSYEGIYDDHKQMHRNQGDNLQIWEYSVQVANESMGHYEQHSGAGSSSSIQDISQKSNFFSNTYLQGEVSRSNNSHGSHSMNANNNHNNSSNGQTNNSGRTYGNPQQIIPREFNHHQYNRRGRGGYSPGGGRGSQNRDGNGEFGGAGHHGGNGGYFGEIGGFRPARNGSHFANHGYSNQNLSQDYSNIFANPNPHTMFNFVHNIDSTKLNDSFLNQYLDSTEVRFKDFKNSRDSQFISINFSRALLEFAKLVKRNPTIKGMVFSVIQSRPEWVLRWCEETYPVLHRFDPRNLSNTIYAMGLLKIKQEILFQGGWMNKFLETSSTKLNDCNPQELSNSIYAMGVLKIDLNELCRPGGWMTNFLLKTVARLRQFNSQGLSNAIYAMALLGMKTDDLAQGNWLHMFLEVSLSKLKECNSQELSNIVYALALLKVKVDVLYRGGWMSAFLTATQDAFSWFNAQDFSNTIYALAIIGLKNEEFHRPGGWMSNFLAACHMKLSTFGVQSLTNTIYAMGLLGIRNEEVFRPGGWLNSFLTVTTLKMNEIHSQGLSNIMYGLALLDVKSDVLVQGGWMNSFLSATINMFNQNGMNPQGMSNIIYGLALIKIKKDVLMRGGWMTSFLLASSTQINDFNPQELSNTIYALGLIGIESTTLSQGRWINGFLAKSQSKFNEFTVQGLSNTIYALGVLGISSELLLSPRGWIHSFLSTTLWRLNTYNAQGLSNTIYAFGLLGISTEILIQGGWLRAFLTSSKDRLNNYSPQNLSNTVYALGMIRVDTDMLFQSGWIKIFMPACLSKLNQFTTQHLSNTLFALALLDIDFKVLSQDDWISHFLQAVTLKLDEFDKSVPKTRRSSSGHAHVAGATTSSKHLMGFLENEQDDLSPDSWMKSILSSHDDAAMQSINTSLSLFGEEQKDIIQGNASAKGKFLSEKHQLFMFHQHLLAKENVAFLSSEIASIWAEEFKDHASDRVAGFKIDPSLQEILQQYYPSFLPMQYVEAIGSTVDFYDQYSNSILQFDGPSHFLANGCYNGPSVFQTTLLERFGYRVIRLSSSLWRGKAYMERLDVIFALFGQYAEGDQTAAAADNTHGYDGQGEGGRILNGFDISYQFTENPPDGEVSTVDSSPAW